MTDPENRTEEDTVRLDLAGLVDPDPTAYVERYRPPVPPPRMIDRCAGMLDGALCLLVDGHDGPHKSRHVRWYD